MDLGMQKISDATWMDIDISHKQFTDGTPYYMLGKRILFKRRVILDE